MAISIHHPRSLPRPAPAMLVLLVLWAALGLAASIDLAPALAWQAAGVALALIATLDAWRVARQPTPGVERRVPDTWPIGVERLVTLKLESATPQRLDVFDLHPGSWAMHGLPRQLQMRRGETASLNYALRANPRGDFVFDGVHLRPSWLRRT